jgi:hypothetical protein
MKTKFFLVLLAVLLVAVAAFPYPALADTGSITQGDTEFASNTFTTGSQEILSLQSDIVSFNTAPADFHRRRIVIIKPFAAWDGMHFCVNDWHVLLIAEFDGGDKSYTIKDARSYLSQVDNLFYLDGNPVRTSRTPIKRLLPPPNGLEKAYGFQTFTIMTPRDLQVGQHTFNVHVVDPVYGNADLAITFYVDDSNSSTCN